MILIGDKGMDTPHLVWLCGALRDMCIFQGLLHRCAPRAIAAQWGEPTSENSGSLYPALSFGCGSSPESATKEKEMQKCISFFLVHFQGLEPWAH